MLQRRRKHDYKCDVCGMGCMDYDEPQRIAEINYEPPAVEACKSCMSTIQRLNKFRTKAHELQGSVTAHKHTISQLLERISVLEHSDRSNEKISRQEALLVKQMKALKKALARQAAHKTAQEQAEARLLRSEAEKERIRIKVRELQTRLKSGNPETISLKQRVRELEMQVSLAAEPAALQSLQSENDALLLEVRAKDEELERMRQYIAERERTDAEMFKQLYSRMSPPRPKKGQANQPMESDSDNSSSIIGDEAEDEQIALRQHISRRSSDSTMQRGRFSPPTKKDFGSALQTKLSQYTSASHSIDLMTAQKAEHRYSEQHDRKRGGIPQVQRNEFPNTRERLHRALREGPLSDDEGGVWSENYPSR